VFDGLAEEPLLRPGDSVVTLAVPPGLLSYTPLSPEWLGEIRTTGVTCHVGPEGSWEAPEGVLGAAPGPRAVGGARFTARHISDKLKRTRGSMLLVLDPGPTPSPTIPENESPAWEVSNTLVEALGERLHGGWAPVRQPGQTAGGLFATAYRLGVVVRD